MPWVSMDVDKIIGILSKQFSVRHATYFDVANGLTEIDDSIVVHACSHQPEYKIFAEDVLLYLQAQGNRLVPSIHIARSLENKGYQELYKRLRGIKSLTALYIAKPSELDAKSLTYPVVFKSTTGFGSSGVQLVQTPEGLRHATRAESYFTLSQVPKIIRSKIGYFVRKYLLGRKNLRPYGDYYSPMKRFVLQQFIPNLSFDYKVLVYQERAFVLKRSVADDDFRASGSEKFAFEDPPDGLLDYARSLLRQFDEPYLSLDICFDGSKFYLIECQGVHFGPYTLLNAPKHYVWNGAEWGVEYGCADLEEVTAESLVLYIAQSNAH